jgi:hypothetical protein
LLKWTFTINVVEPIRFSNFTGSLPVGEVLAALVTAVVDVMD